MLNNQIEYHQKWTQPQITKKEESNKNEDNIYVENEMKIKDNIWNAKTTNVKLYIAMEALEGGGGWWGGLYPAKPYSCLQVCVFIQNKSNVNLM